MLLRLSVFFCLVVPVLAQDYQYIDLSVCNRGSVPVEAIAANNEADIFRGIGHYYWHVEGKQLPPGKCDVVYHSMGSDHAYLAFVSTDARGQWRSGTVSSVPDFGIRTYAPLVAVALHKSQEDVLSAAKMTFCARGDHTLYKTPDENLTKTDCSHFHVTGESASYIAATAYLDFRPEPRTCSNSSVGGFLTPCSNPSYYLNVTPRPNETDVHPTVGSPSGEDAKQAPEATPEQVRQFLKDNGIIRNPNEPSLRERNILAQQRQQEATQLAPQAAQNLNNYWNSPVHPVSEFTTQWVGQTLVVQGTVSQVTVDKGGDQRLHIWFAESSYSNLTGCSPIPDALAKIYGQDFSGLIGKVVQIAGEVENRCGPRKDIYIVDPRQLRVVPNPAHR